MGAVVRFGGAAPQQTVLRRDCVSEKPLEE